jgi:precorrin-2 dehydrogenase/sirohydrochlorin ferrochelatase
LDSTREKEMAGTYPIALTLAERPVLVVGGGTVAARKVVGLLECDALVTVVAPRLGSETRALVDDGRCEWRARAYRASDLDGMTLVFCCTDDTALNARVSAEAKERGLLVNVADCPELCGFFLPSVLRRGRLSIAVSTDGSSPLLARKIRTDLEPLFADDMAEYLELLRSWRPVAMGALPADRLSLFWQQATDGRVYDLVHSGRIDEAKALMNALMNSLLIAQAPGSLE